MTKAESILPLLKRAIALQVELWDVTTDMEAILGHDFSVEGDLGEFTAGIDTPDQVTLDVAADFIKHVTEE